VNKKGGTAFSTLIFAFFRFTILVFVALALVFFTRQFMKVSIDVNEVEAEIFSHGLMNSPNGISYVDPAGRMHPGMVNAQDFKSVFGTKTRLETAFYYEDNRFIAAQIQLYKNGQAYLEPVYYNKEFFNIWQPFGMTKFKGKGSAFVTEKYYPVQVKDNDVTEEALMKITVAIPRS